MSNSNTGRGSSSSKSDSQQGSRADLEMKAKATIATRAATLRRSSKTKVRPNKIPLAAHDAAVRMSST